MRRSVAGWTLTCYIVILLWLTFHQWGDHAVQRSVQLMPLTTIIATWQSGGRIALINILGNIVAFVPIGGFARLWQPHQRWQQIVIGGAGLSLSIEVMQWLSGYRVADIDDLLLNIVGCGVGIGLASIVFTRQA
ncbi:MAG: VanZ family protein [Herpetosiphon sp.]|nr:VanZ family protein [Herpetosiphon sp.]